VPIAEKQLAANRANADNAVKGAGPRTPGSAHGFTVSNSQFSGSKSTRSLISKPTSPPSTSPSTSRNCSPSKRMALTQQTMLRAARLECGPRRPWTTCRSISEITHAQNRIYALDEGFYRMARQPKNNWSLFLRYHYRRAVDEFDRFKALRAELPNEPILEVQPEENKPACAPADKPISNPQPNQEPRRFGCPEVGAVGGRPSRL
jgi:hypothetical protein